MKGGDGANNTVAAHSAFVHAGAQLELAPGEVRPKVVPRGTVDRCTSMVMMTSAAAVRFEHRTLYIKHRTFKPSLRSFPVTPPRFRSLGQPETRLADEKVVT
jgi:hypothetical protein